MDSPCQCIPESIGARHNRFGMFYARYFYRYPSTMFRDRAFDADLTRKWLPVDMYVGGNEHAVLHLLYARFLCMAFKHIGLIDFEEPFKRFVAHGLIVRDGAKMSKSKGNVVNPDEYIDRYGSGSRASRLSKKSLCRTD